MAVALTRHFENLRYLQTLFYTYSKEPNAEFANRDKTRYVKIFNNNQKDNLINILNLEQSYEIDIM